MTVCDKDAAERGDNYKNVTVKKPQRLPIKPFYKRIKELDDLQVLLPCLKDQPGCPPEVERRNVSMTPFAMCGLLMRNVSVQIEDEYNCLHNTVPTDPKLLVEQLTRIETKLSSSGTQEKAAKSSDRERQSDDQPRSRAAKKRAKEKSGKREELQHVPIPRKPFPSRADKSCKLCAEYGGASNTHKTAACKKWLPGGKTHHEWKGGKTPANINVHQGSDTNQLMAQQAEFQKKLMKKFSKFERKKKKSSKRSRDRYSSSSSSDSD